MAKPPHVLVLGGGFVAHGATRALRRHICHGEVTLTVVDRDNFFTFHGLIGEMVSGRVLPSNILNPARRVFAPAQVHVAEIETVDLGEKRVVIALHEDQANQLQDVLLSTERIVARTGLFDAESLRRGGPET